MQAQFYEEHLDTSVPCQEFCKMARVKLTLLHPLLLCHHCRSQMMSLCATSFSQGNIIKFTHLKHKVVKFNLKGSTNILAKKRIPEPWGMNITRILKNYDETCHWESIPNYCRTLKLDMVTCVVNLSSPTRRCNLAIETRDWTILILFYWL